MDFEDDIPTIIARINSRKQDALMKTTSSEKRQRIEGGEGEVITINLKTSTEKIKDDLKEYENTKLELLIKQGLSLVEKPDDLFMDFTTPIRETFLESKNLINKVIIIPELFAWYKIWGKDTTLFILKTWMVSNTPYAKFLEIIKKISVAKMETLLDSKELALLIDNGIYENVLTTLPTKKNITSMEMFKLFKKLPSVVTNVIATDLESRSGIDLTGAVFAPGYYFILQVEPSEYSPVGRSEMVIEEIDKMSKFTKQVKITFIKSNVDTRFTYQMAVKIFTHMLGKIEGAYMKSIEYPLFDKFLEEEDSDVIKLFAFHKFEMNAYNADFVHYIKSRGDKIKANKLKNFYLMTGKHAVDENNNIIY